MAICGDPLCIYRVFKFWPTFVGETETRMSCNEKPMNASLKSENSKCDKHERTIFWFIFRSFLLVEKYQRLNVTIFGENFYKRNQ